MIVPRTRAHIMFWTFGGLILALLCLGVHGSQSLYDLQWLPCPFVDENVHKNDEGHTETKYITREAVLQFGIVVDMRRYLEGTEDKLQCEIRRYSTGGIVMRWPTAGEQDHDVWFTCTLRHSEGLFVVTTFLRHTTAAPAEGQVGFLKEPNLHCQFAVDHKLPNATVEWRLQKHGERSKLFSYSSRTGKAEGSGVAVKAIAAGNASFKLPPTRKHSEGTYICSVMVPPLFGSHDIPLTLSEGYYPLDVNIEWYREAAGGSPTPLFLKNVLYSSHRLHQDGTYSLSAFFYLQPSLEDSGYKYTCRVSHKSLLTPIRKSFSLIVTEPDSTLWYITAIGFIIAMLVVLCYVLPQYLAGRKAAKKVRMKVGIEE
ncbi:Tapasin-related protein [Labeo rohita]|uniref:Tapasin-related protein n=1 Tax=Labeo rohita TaxID=84645 RepID=A0ABQ8M232_LABRO|nr:Tapasin-related protein [Labeo rohita]